MTTRSAPRTSLLCLALAALAVPDIAAGQSGDFDVPQVVLDPRGHQATPRALAFTPDGTQVLSAGLDKVVRVWEVADGRPRLLRTLRPPIWRGPAGGINAIALAPRPIPDEPGQHYLAVGGYGVTQPRGAVLLYRYPGRPEFPTGDIIALLPAWNPGAEEPDRHRDPITGLAFSPDGRHLIYFALNGKWESPTGGSWTALSRAPFLKALVLWGKGDGWHGGGLFTGPGRYWLHDGSPTPGYTVHALLRDSPELARDLAFDPEGGVGGECLGVYFPRLLREGWRLVDARTLGVGKRVFQWEKALPGGWILRKIARAQVEHPVGKGCYWDEHSLVDPTSGVIIDHPDWEWAEWRDGRLLWAAGGRIHAAGLDEARGTVDEHLLIDLNGLTFERRIAPY